MKIFEVIQPLFELTKKPNLPEIERLAKKHGLNNKKKKILLDIVQMKPSNTQNQMLNVMSSMGAVVDSASGKGTHIKVTMDGPKGKVSAAMPSRTSANMSVQTVRYLLELLVDTGNYVPLDADHSPQTLNVKQNVKPFPKIMRFSDINHANRYVETNQKALKSESGGVEVMVDAMGVDSEGIQIFSIRPVDQPFNWNQAWDVAEQMGIEPYEN